MAVEVAEVEQLFAQLKINIMLVAEVEVAEVMVPVEVEEGHILCLMVLREVQEPA